MKDEKKQDKKREFNDSKYSTETHLIYGKNVSDKWDYSHHVTAPISSSTTFRLDTVERGAMGFANWGDTLKHEGESPIYIYDRLGEPNKDMLEENLAMIEKGETAVTFSSGMAAISGVLGVLTKSGDEIITHNTLYGCTISLFKNWYPRINIISKQIDLTEPENIYSTVNENTRVIYFETPANPNLDIIDITAIKKIVAELNANRDNKIQIVVDNTFSTPYCQRPIEFGADFTIHSLTKGIGGFGTEIGGAVIGRKEYRDRLLLYRKDFGGVLSPRSAWSILTYGLPTVALRQSKSIESAKKIAEYLENHPKVEFVNYPGLASYKYYELAKKQMVDFNGNFAPGHLIYFVLKADNADASKDIGKNFMNYIADHAYTMTLAVSLGHTRTLIEHPASMTHSVVPTDELHKFGLHAGGVRLAVGIENPDDILLDLEESLKDAI